MENGRRESVWLFPKTAATPYPLSQRCISLSNLNVVAAKTKQIFKLRINKMAIDEVTKSKLEMTEVLNCHWVQLSCMKTLKIKCLNNLIRLCQIDITH